MCMETPCFESTRMEEDMDSVSLPEPESLEESGTPLFSGEFRFCMF